MSTIGEFIGHMFCAQDVAKSQHWLSGNEGQHLALEMFYTQATPIVDRLAETWRGKGKGPFAVVRVENCLMTDIVIIPYFTDLANRCEAFKASLATDTTLSAILDDLLELIYITIDRLGRV